MKVGFSILSHKNVDLVFDHLIHQLKKYPSSHIAIHHDFSKAEADFTNYTDENLEIVDDYVQTSWSHVNNIKALLKTFELLYKENCDWYITLSANCYPVKDIAYILNFLEQTDVDAYIEHNDVNTDHFDFYTYFRKALYFKKRWRIPFFRKNGTFYWKTIWRKRTDEESLFHEGFIPYHGSDWFMLNKKSMEYILSQKNEIQKMISFFEDVNSNPDFNICPPEMVFHSILANNKELILKQYNYRYIDWSGSSNWHPNTLTENNFESIRQSKALFARKLEEGASTSLLHRLNVLLNESFSSKNRID